MFGTQSAYYFTHLAGIRPSQSLLVGGGGGSSWTQPTLAPAVTCEYLSSDVGLASVAATLNISRGTIASSWRLHTCPHVPVPPPPPRHPKVPSACGTVEETNRFHPNSTGRVELRCGDGNLALGHIPSPGWSCGCVPLSRE